MKFAILLFFFSFNSYAMVAITNGNYFNGFSDLIHQGATDGFQLRIERTYNSRSQYDGLFGYGWGTDFETYLITSADGSVIVQESGGGEKTRFTPKTFKKESLQSFATRMAKAKAKTKFKFKRGKGYTDEKTYIARLLRDADFRDEEGRALGITPKLPVGTKLFSTARGNKQIVTVIKGGFKRSYADGKTAEFTQLGDVKDFGVGVQRVLKNVYKITKFYDPIKKKSIFYQYNRFSQLEVISDGKNQKITFTYTKIGKIATVTDANKRTASYEYCKAKAYRVSSKCSAGDLVKSTDAAGNVYQYEYDNVHNMTKIIFSDKTFEEVAYWPAKSAGEGGVKSVLSRTGVFTEYVYESDPKEKRLHYKTTVKTTYKSGRKTTASYEYWRRRRADGSTYKYKMATVINGDKTETIYNECCGQPLQITNAQGLTKFEYYKVSGLPKLKDTPTESTYWEYSTKCQGKVTLVKVASKLKKGKVLASKFTYNLKCNLQKAKTSDGRGVALLYDRFDRIKTMVDQEKRKIFFKYNALSKPIEIRQESVGSITVVYDGKGNIQKVNSKGGRQIALSVTAAFQNLLEIIKPAGVQPI